MNCIVPQFPLRVLCVFASGLLASISIAQSVEVGSLVGPPAPAADKSMTFMPERNELSQAPSGAVVSGVDREALPLGRSSRRENSESKSVSANSTSELSTGLIVSPAAGESDAKPVSIGGILDVALPLAFVLGLALLASYVFRKAAAKGGLGARLGAGGRAPSGILEVLGRYPICRGHTLVLLKLDRRILLISHERSGKLGSQSEMRTLAEITEPQDVASILLKIRESDSDSLAGRFQNILTHEAVQHEQAAEPPLASGWRSIFKGRDGDRAELLQPVAIASTAAVRSRPPAEPLGATLLHRTQAVAAENASGAAAAAAIRARLAQLRAGPVHFEVTS